MSFENEAGSTAGRFNVLHLVKGERLMVLSPSLGVVLTAVRTFRATKNMATTIPKSCTYVLAYSALSFYNRTAVLAFLGTQVAPSLRSYLQEFGTLHVRLGRYSVVFL